MYNIRTDLALESTEVYKRNKSQEIEGVVIESDNSDNDIIITRVAILNHDGEKALNKPIGNYITLEVPNLVDNLKDLNEKVELSLAHEITSLAKYKENKGDNNILVVGLGNWNVTPDSLGPKVVDKIAITRHLKEYASEYIEPSTSGVCAVAPGVLGITGIETAEVIRGLVEKVRPTLVIAIDALASRRMDRISTTIQISNTGIVPGSGVGNKRTGLTEETLGIPVIAIGIPTVVDAITIASDSMDMVIDEVSKQVDNNSQAYFVLNNMRENEYDLSERILAPFIGNLVVTPKEIDSIISNISHVIGNAINISIHGSLDEAEKYII